ncbi:hypothetical protein AVEN_187412-1, partial [Araneus ventricosus]
MACGGWNSTWTDIGTKNQRDPQRGYRKEQCLAGHKENECDSDSEEEASTD